MDSKRGSTDIWPWPSDPFGSISFGIDRGASISMGPHLLMLQHCVRSIGVATDIFTDCGCFLRNCISVEKYISQSDGLYHISKGASSIWPMLKFAPLLPPFPSIKTLASSSLFGLHPRAWIYVSLC